MTWQATGEAIALSHGKAHLLGDPRAILRAGGWRTCNALHMESLEAWDAYDADDDGDPVIIEIGRDGRVRVSGFDGRVVGWAVPYQHIRAFADLAALAEETEP